jgi:hypothetical protein
MDCLQGQVSPTEIVILIRGLRPGSRFVSLMQGGEQFQEWNVMAYQMANIIDAINNNTYVLTAANSKRKPKAPKPSYRPSKAKQKPQNAFRTQLEMAKQRKARGG